MSLELAILEARRAINRDLIPARLGNGTGTVYDLTTPGNYFLRKLEANGNFSQPFSLPVNPLASIPPVDGLPVSIGYDVRGTQVIWQADNVSMVSANVSPLILNPLDTAVYGKTSQTNLATLYYQRHGDTTNFPFTVVVFKAPVIINGVAKMFAGAGISLSGFVPATGLHCYASVFLKTDMTLEAFASTPKNLLDPLTVDVDIQDCISQSSANSIIICAFEIFAGDTALSPKPERNVDMRQVVNTDNSSGSTAYYQTVQDNGTPQTQRSNLNFIGATVADNPGNDSTDVTVSGSSLTVTDGSTTVTDVTSLTFNGTEFTVTDLGGGAAQVDSIGGGAVDYPKRFSVMCDELLVYNASNTPIAVTTQYVSTQCYTIDTEQGSPNNGDYFTCSFTLQTGTYTCYVLGISAANRGKIDFTLDGVSQVTGQDWYNALTTFNTVLSFTLTASTDGYHVLKGTINGHTVGSTGYYFGLTKIWCVPSAD